MSRTIAALIPEKKGLNGATTLSKMRTTAVGYFLLFGIGLSLALFHTVFWKTFGLGLTLPGAGFLHFIGGSTGQIILYSFLFLFTLLLFGVGFFLWFGTGNILAPIVVWVGAAIIAGGNSTPIVFEQAPLTTATIVLLSLPLVLFFRNKTYQEEKASRLRRNKYLKAYNDTIATETPKATSKTDIPIHELSPTSLGIFRYLLDRALQPIPDFNGFDFVDQFQTAALRYQVCGMGYAFNVIHRNCTPAFRGYFTKAQRNLHQKMAEHKIWKYWALENAWGNFKLDANPVGKDNVMYTGWLAAMLGEYMMATGDRYWLENPLVLKHPKGKEFRYNFSDLVENMVENIKGSDFCLYPCEPNWIYPMCNNFAAIAVNSHDTLMGTNHWEGIKHNFKEHFDQDFMTLDGRAIAIRSSRTGLTIPALTSVMADSIVAHFISGYMPDIANRSWQIVKNDYTEITENDIVFKTRGWDALDTGTYKPSLISTYAAVGMAAGEMGDATINKKVIQQVEKEFEYVREDGIIYLKGISLQAHTNLITAYLNIPKGRYNLLNHPLLIEQIEGPILQEANYPEVMVALAKNDGQNLQLVLYPGRDKTTTQTLGIVQLIPNQSYVCTGTIEQEIIADVDGKATLTVQLEGRTPIEINKK